MYVCMGMCVCVCINNFFNPPNNAMRCKYFYFPHYTYEKTCTLSHISSRNWSNGLKPNLADSPLPDRRADIHVADVICRHRPTCSAHTDSVLRPSPPCRYHY